MKKFLIAVCSIVLAIGVSGCVGKAPVGKGKAPPPVVTRGWSTIDRSPSTPQSRCERLRVAASCRNPACRLSCAILIGRASRLVAYSKKTAALGTIAF